MDKYLDFACCHINQTDTVRLAEIERFPPVPAQLLSADNDRLAELVMSGLEAESAVLLTNVDGLLSKRKDQEQWSILAMKIDPR